MQDAQIHAIFDRVDEHVRHRISGRRLETSEIGYTPPTSHKSNEYIAALLDWRSAVRQMHKAAGVLRRRDEWLLNQVVSSGELPSGELPDEHKTGIALLDVNAPPSIVGNMFRRLSAYIREDRPDAHASEMHARRLNQARHATRPGSKRRTMLGSMFTASLMGGNPVKAAKNHLQTSNDHRSRLRRLSEGFFDAAATLPITGVGVATRTAEYPRSGSNVFEDTLRYVVYDVFLCYLYKPDATTDAAFGDGTRLTTHRTHRLCFPAIPFLVEPARTFDETFGLQDVDLNTLAYDTSCEAVNVKAALAAVGMDSLADPLTAPIAGVFLRTAEGMDAIRNLAKSGNFNITSRERASAIVCAITQLGGLFLGTLAVVVALALLLCAPLGSAVCVWSVRSLINARRLRRNREEKMDRLLAKNHAEKEDERQKLIGGEDGPPSP